MDTGVRTPVTPKGLNPGGTLVNPGGDGTLSNRNSPSFSSSTTGEESVTGCCSDSSTDSIRGI